MSYLFIYFFLAFSPTLTLGNNVCLKRTRTSNRCDTVQHGRLSRRPRPAMFSADNLICCSSALRPPNVPSARLLKRKCFVNVTESPFGPGNVCPKATVLARSMWTADSDSWVLRRCVWQETERENVCPPPPHSPV